MRLSSTDATRPPTFDVRTVGVGLLCLLVALGACTDKKRQTGDEPLPPTVNYSVLEAFERDIGEIMLRQAQRRALEEAVRTTIDNERVGDASLRHASVLSRVYEQRDFRPVWFGGRDVEFAPTGAAMTLKGRLVDAVRTHGLWPDQVHVSTVRNVSEKNTHCCGRWPDLELTADQREALSTHLSTQRMDLTVADDLDRLAALAADPDGPTPRLARAVDERIGTLRKAYRTMVRREVLLSDGLAEYLMAMRYENPAWHQPRSWRSTFRLGDRGPVRSSTYAGDEKETTAAREMRDAVQRARTRTMLVETLVGVFEEPASVGEAMAGVVPPYRAYERLTEAFRRYRPIVERGGWPTLPSSAQGLERGDVSRVVRVLKERLRIEGYWTPPKPDPEPTMVATRSGSSATAAAASSAEVVEKQARAQARADQPRTVDDYEMVFDDRLERAVLAYQNTHQLWDHGSVTPETLRSLNVSARERWNQMRVTLQRWRESNIGADSHYVHVNVADFHAEVWRDGEREMRFRTITGQSTRKEDEETGTVRYPHATPTFSDTIEYIVLNPYWNVPHSIVKNELRPKLEENPDYYEENGFEVVVSDTGRKYVRQKPGPENSLGKVKFLFPNDHSVYLHDTPTKHLFDKPVRAYSHGCVRIQKPMEFAHYLLDLDGRWTGDERKKQLEEWFAKEGETWLALREPVPIHIEYYVVRVDGDGRANFLADVYDRDEPRLAEVDERLATYAHGYDLRMPAMSELLTRALSGELDPARDL